MRQVVYWLTPINHWIQNSHKGEAKNVHVRVKWLNKKLVFYRKHDYSQIRITFIIFRELPDSEKVLTENI